MEKKQPYVTFTEGRDVGKPIRFLLRFGSAFFGKGPEEGTGSTILLLLNVDRSV